MIDVSWQEIMVIAAVAVIVIGPKDLPNAIKTVAQWVRKAREMAGEFQRGVDEMVREAELADVRKQVEQATSSVVDDVTKMADNTIGEVKKSVDPTGDIEKALQAPETFATPPSLEPAGPPAPVESASLPPPAVAPTPTEAPAPTPDPAQTKPAA
ncbi:MAG: twin-arginine translocase subunit TatB [Alphaproteobacteria bacterium]|nr:twin-arginine translocase subunit TatB [Alphaproteobacteria bacterium]